MIVGFLALCVALGGGAYAAKKKHKKVPYKGLDKDARLKVLPVSNTNAGTNCDPNSKTTYTNCTSVDLTVSTTFPRRVALTFNGIFDSAQTAPPPADPVIARGECRLELDGQPLNGTPIRVEPGAHTDPTTPAMQTTRLRRRLRDQHRQHAAGRQAHLLGRLQRDSRAT